jgi:DNA-directed RNA polymerase subunit M/transcription elongation factor TFIIS
MQINLEYFYKKYDIDPKNKIKKEELLIAKFIAYCKYLHFGLNEEILMSKMKEINKILLYKISYHPLDVFGCLYIKNKITSDQICCILFKVKYEEIEIPRILNMAKKYLNLIQSVIDNTDIANVDNTDIDTDADSNTDADVNTDIVNTNIVNEDIVNEDIVNADIANGENDIADADSETIDPTIIIDDNIIKLFTSPRSMATVKIIDYLYEYYDQFNYDIEYIISISKIIEKSCYNSTISNCRQSDTPPPRNWDSLEFFETYYSSKCGLVLRLLYKNSQSVREYGQCLVNGIIDKSIPIEKIGFMSESELCPIAQLKEKTDLNIRMNQKIKHKYSELYKCPACHQNKSTPATKQLRSADEESDVICTCICGFKFKIK